jgi:hypothetical protein
MNLTPSQEHDTWQFRAIAATRGPQTQLGAILIAMIRPRDASKPGPWFGASAIITSDGYIQSDFMDRHGQFHTGALVGSVRDLIGNLRGLADHLKFSDEERTAMFTEARRWISMDYRPEGARTWA